MFRSGNNRQSGAFGGASKTEFSQNTNTAIHNWQDGAGQPRYYWSFHGEVELPASGCTNSATSHGRAADDLGALLDRALAFAG